MENHTSRGGWKSLKWKKKTKRNFSSSKMYRNEKERSESYKQNKILCLCCKNSKLNRKCDPMAASTMKKADIFIFTHTHPNKLKWIYVEMEHKTQTKWKKETGCWKNSIVAKKKFLFKDWPCSPFSISILTEFDIEKHTDCVYFFHVIVIVVEYECLFICLHCRATEPWYEQSFTYCAVLFKLLCWTLSYFV